jgi:hypothetical protein
MCIFDLLLLLTCCVPLCLSLPLPLPLCPPPNTDTIKVRLQTQPMDKPIYCKWPCWGVVAGHEALQLFAVCT